MVETMKPYIFALSYFDHLRGSEIRRYCADPEDKDAVGRLIGWIVNETQNSEPSLYWDSKRSARG